MSAVLDLRRVQRTTTDYASERLLIFDVESLLLDPTEGMRSSLHCALQELGVSLSDNAFRHWSLRTPLRESLAILMQCRDSQKLDRAAALFHLHYEQTGRFRANLRPGSVGLLKRLCSDPRFELHYLTHIGMHAAARLLDQHGLGGFVRSIVSGEDSSGPGIRPQLIRRLVTCSGRSPSRWILLSDHPIEILTAQDMHLHSIALGYGRAPLPTLLQLDPDAIAADVLDVGTQLGALLEPRRSITLPMSSHQIN